MTQQLFTPSFYRKVDYKWVTTNLRGAKFYTLKLIYRYLKENNYTYFCYHRLERYYHFRKKIDRVDYSWHTISRSIRFLANDLHLLNPRHKSGEKGCFEPTQSFHALIENLQEKRWI